MSALMRDVAYAFAFTLALLITMNGTLFLLYVLGGALA